LSLYLDASVQLPMIVAELDGSVVDSFLRTTAGALAVSHFAADLHRRYRGWFGCIVSTATAATAKLADFDEWRACATANADIDANDCRLADSYVRRFDLKRRAPDALHVAICRRLGLQLVTLDRRLAAAAREPRLTVYVPAN
jgi:predicted nucleic acid-binding protein